DIAERGDEVLQERPRGHREAERGGEIDSLSCHDGFFSCPNSRRTARCAVYWSHDAATPTDRTTDPLRRLAPGGILGACRGRRRADRPEDAARAGVRGRGGGGGRRVRGVLQPAAADVAEGAGVGR